MRLAMGQHQARVRRRHLRGQVVERRERCDQTGRMLGHECTGGLGVGATAPGTTPFP